MMFDKLNAVYQSATPAGGWRPSRYGLDGWFVLAASLLFGWGLIMVSSASVDVAVHAGHSPFYFLERQSIFACLGLMLGRLIFYVPMRWWEKTGPLLLIGAIFLLLLVLIPGLGQSLNHARRWLNLGVISLQVSEPARLAVIIYLAGYIVRREGRLQVGWKGLLVPFIPLSIVSVFLLLEPDFGATAILWMVAMLMLLLGGARVVAWLGVSVLAAAGLAGLVGMASYRMRRLLSFTNPWADAEHTGWQLTQSLIAIGRGNWIGVGLGNSVQKLLYLPEMHTDFIFAILAEEFGLCGVSLLMCLYALLVGRGFVIGAQAEKLGCKFQANLCYGLSSWIGLQALINMGVNMGVLPTKGLTLPLFSYGGSSLLTVFSILALILRVDHENRMHAAGHPTMAKRTVSTAADRRNKERVAS